MSGLAPEEERRVISELEGLARDLPGDWREKILAAYPLKRRAAGLRSDLEPRTLEFADALYSYLNQPGEGIPETSRRAAAAALLYFIDADDVLPDATHGRGYLDDFHAIRMVAGKIMPGL